MHIIKNMQTLWSVTELLYKTKSISHNKFNQTVLTFYFGGYMNFFVNDDCIGCGLCPSVCPEVFSMTDDGVAKAVDADIEGSTAVCAEKAQQQCPVNAIEHN